MQFMRMPAIRVYVIIALLLIMVGGYFYQQFKTEISNMVSDDPRVWESAIQDIEVYDQSNPSPQDVVLFIGSSSIRLWQTLSEDMQPLVATGRGFGGAKVTDLNYYIERLLKPHQPSAIVIYIGSNDFINMFGNKAKTLQQVLGLYRQLLEKIRNSIGNVPVYMVALKPTPATWEQWPLLDTFNRSLAAMAATDGGLYFIDANAGLYGDNNEPDRSLVKIDRLHLNDKGYKAWAAAIKQPILEHAGQR